jgi:hypothetical protein
MRERERRGLLCKLAVSVVPVAGLRPRAPKNQFSSRALLARDPTGSVRAGLFSLFSTTFLQVRAPQAFVLFFYSSTTECVRFLPSPHATKYVGAHNYHYRSFNWFSFPSYLQRSHTLSSI